MSLPSHETLNRLQNESHIPIGTWYHWCNQLQMDVEEAVIVWEEICRPLLLVYGEFPDVAFILQLRALRSNLDIIDFREQLPPLLQIFDFLPGLADECLAGERLRRSILRLYARLATPATAQQKDVTRCFLFEFCSAVLLAKVLETQRTNLSGVLKVVAEKRLGDLAQWGLRVADPAPYGEAVRSCLEECMIYADAAASSPAESASSDAEEPWPHSHPGDMTTYLTHFKEALQAIYIAAAGEAAGDPDVGDLLADRLQTITDFNPLTAYIPSAEEAWNAVQQTEATSGLDRKAVIAQARTSGHSPITRSKPGKLFTASGSPPRGSADLQDAGQQVGRMQVISAGGGTRPAVDPPTPVPAGPVERAAPRGAPAKGESPAPSENAVTIESARRIPLDDAVRAIGRSLAELEAADPTVWLLFLDPTAEVEALLPLARDLCAEDSAASQAFKILETVARWQSLKHLISLPADRRINPRAFVYDVKGFVNYTTTARKNIDSDSRVLIPLPRILDFASASLIRLRGLRECLEQAGEEGEALAPQTVIDSCASALSAIIQRIDDKDLLTQTRTRGDADIAALLEKLAAEGFVEQLLETCRAFAQRLEEEDCTVSAERLDAALAEQPFAIGDAQSPETADEPASTGQPAPTDEEDLDTPSLGLPKRFQETSGLGPIVDRLRQHLFGSLAQVLQPIHAPETVYQRVDDLLRQLLLARAVLRPRKERHQKNPRIALSVVGLDKITDNPALASLFVRLRVDGHLLFVEGFESGDYVDLFELREHSRAQMHARARKKATEGNTGELQLGSSYLHSVGRSNQLFGADSAAVKNSCLRTEDGKVRIFPIFT